MRKDPKGEYIPMTTTPVITHPDTRKLRRAELDLLIAQARIRRLEERIKELEEK